MIMIKKPMLSGVADLDKIKFPILISPKIDGIRCLKVDGRALTRKFKPIPNRHIRQWIEATLPDGLDGEITLMDESVLFREISSAVMSEEGEPDFLYNAFDYVTDGFEQPFSQRYENIANIFGYAGMDHFLRTPHTIVEDIPSLLKQHDFFIDMGYEGTMIRDPNGPYKNGRSTVREGYLLKLKNFADEEATIVGFEAFKTNTNKKEVDELGHTKRSSAKDGMVKKEMVGSIKLVFKDGAEFSCGSGLSLKERKDLWKIRDQYMGRQVKIKYQPPRVKGEPPRFPVFLGFRLD